MWLMKLWLSQNLDNTVTFDRMLNSIGFIVVLTFWIINEIDELFGKHIFIRSKKEGGWEESWNFLHVCVFYCFWTIVLLSIFANGQWGEGLENSLLSVEVTNIWPIGNHKLLLAQSLLTRLLTLVETFRKCSLFE